MSPGWIPLSKELTRYLPVSRPYSNIEAAFSLSVDYDNGNQVSISGYAKLWRWSRKKVRMFLTKLGIEIVYPENTKKIQSSNG
jgi:hypothetical protein